MPFVEEYYDIDIRRLFRINNSYSDDYVLTFAAASAFSVFNDNPYVSILVYGYVVQWFHSNGCKDLYSQVL